METTFERTYSLRYYEMDSRGQAEPATMLTLLEECAAEHCEAIGYGLYELRKRDIGWVLLGGSMRMERYPRYRETVRVRTWLSKYSLVRGYRENLILDEAGAVIGRAKGVWAFYDIEKRRPVPVFGEIRERWGLLPEEAIDLDADKTELLGSGAPLLEIPVRRSDIDGNRHVNNIRYFRYLLESFPEETLEGCDLREIQARFVAQSTLGDTIRVFRHPEEEASSYLHSMTDASGERLFAVARTRWAQSEAC